MIRYILLDIEGTTTDFNFVHQVLFPYAAKHLAEYIQANLNNPEVKTCLDAVIETVQTEESKNIDSAEAVNYLQQWITNDRKHSALKILQGYIWKSGYEQGDYLGHVYDDVPKCFEQWKQQGLAIGIYSSGSVQAQKLLFKYSNHGDLTPYFSHHFDTTSGHKQEAIAYQNIAEAIGLNADAALFLSDVEAELDTAKTAGMQTTLVVRGVEKPQSKHPVIHTFGELDSVLQAPYVTG